MNRNLIQQWRDMTRRYAHVALALCLIFGPFMLFAQQSSSDTSGYEQQRRKVNELLAQRSARFGQFDESLKKRTGIFGLKTKKDMQASIDILKQIVLTDNDIFRETKALLDYKDFEKSKIAQQATEFDGRINGYIKTISKLQREQNTLEQHIDALEKSNQLYQGLTVLFGLIVAGGGTVVAVRWIKHQKLTKA
ncbi:hypothetical protein SAMN05421747_101308 [Parapedobacter composti]|uniref:Four helix bundle sensory module for signal transduction n=1 Tax=Parapedobacter composti TaxID=623281 RepID=A0A1I1E442_9SPHI|nr:hypothetical protein [Parapedobacter composti]SFB81884.1 hypothetical protein SAMN05421747_101308 [Parapedobacter composti]